MNTKKSIDGGGHGQSGYTAGRHDDDHALERELDPESNLYPRNADDDMLKHELGTDDRFTGRGGPAVRERPSR